MQKTRIEFSINNIIKSALVNLSKKYINNHKFANTIFEIFDYQKVKSIVEEEINACSVVDDTAKRKTMQLSISEKNKLTEYIENACDGDDIQRALRRCIESSTTYKKIQNSISNQLLLLIKKNKMLFSHDTYCSVLEKIGTFFDLTEVDKRIIAFLYSWDEIGEFERLCCDICRNASKSKTYTFLANAINSRADNVLKSIKNLRQKNILETTNCFFPKIVKDIQDYITEFDGSSIGEKFSKRLKFKKTFKLSSFPIQEADITIIKKMLSSSETRHILLYGEPGSGKTEFVKALAKELKKDIYIPNRENKNDAQLTHTNINATLYVAKQYNAIALIDEADEFLETMPSGLFSLFAGKGNNERKGAVNLLLDKASGSVVWISNSIDSIDASTRRRFAYSLRFDGISDIQKETIIKNTISKNKISKKFLPQMKTLAKRYGLTTAGIALVLDKANSISATNDELKNNIEKIAKAHFELLSNKKTVRDEIKIDERFDLSILNIDFPIDLLSETLSNYKIATNNGSKFPLSFLFSGVAGTGKTQLGRYIAESLGKELMLKKMSEISSAYVGETEKNIRRMFLDATNNNAVLMIDEADSLFYNRSNARQSWEITQTNEILAQMENFSGVLICTTNLADNMDLAAMRRFNWKVKFSEPTYEGRVKLYSKFFLDNTTASVDVKDALYSMEGLCPGDFKAVWQKIHFLPNKTDSLILQALKTELAYKKISTNTKRLGFC